MFYVDSANLVTWLGHDEGEGGADRTYTPIEARTRCCAALPSMGCRQVCLVKTATIPNGDSIRGI